jgi:hypothetical protein
MKLNSTTARMFTVAGVGIGAVALIGGTATAASLITAQQMATGSVNSRVLQDGSVHQHDLSAHAKALLNKDKGSFAGAVYRVENYTNGGGGDATVACASDEATSKKYTAVAGGVEAGHTGTNGFSVSASFPGRMDWNTGTPKSGRLDGWIVLGNGQYTDNLKVWALCVPTTDIPVQQVDLDN